MASISVSSMQYNNIKQNLFKDRESFDKEIYNIIKDFNNIEGSLDITFQKVVRSERHLLHKLTSFNYDFISIGDTVNDCRDMVVQVRREHVSNIIKKYKVVKEVFNIEQFKKELMESIKTLIDSKIEILIKNI